MYALWYAYFMIKNSSVNFGDFPLLRKPADKVPSTGTTSSSISAPPEAVKPSPSVPVRAPVRTPSTPKDIPGRSPPVQTPVPPPAKKAPPPVETSNRFLGQGQSIGGYLSACISAIVRKATAEQQASIEALLRTAGHLESDSEKRALEQRIRAELASKDRELAAAIDQCLKEAGQEAVELAVKHARGAFEKATKKFNDEMVAATTKAAVEKAAAEAATALTNRVKEASEKTSNDEFAALEECLKSAATYFASENQAALERCLQNVTARKAAADASAVTTLLEEMKQKIAAAEQNAGKALLKDLQEKEKAEMANVEQCIRDATAKITAQEIARVQQLYKQKAEETLALADTEADMCVQSMASPISAEMRDILEACIKKTAKKKADTDGAYIEELVADATKKIQDEEDATISMCMQRALKKLKGDGSGVPYDDGVGTASGKDEKIQAELIPEDDGKSKAELKPEDDGKSKTELKPEDDGMSKTELKPEDDGMSKTELKPEDDGMSETELKPEDDGMSKTEFKPEDDGMSKTELKPDDGMSQTELKPEDDGMSKTELKPEDDGMSKTELKPEDDGMSQTELKPEDDGMSQTELKPEDDGKSKSESDVSCREEESDSHKDKPALEPGAASAGDSQSSACREDESPRRSVLSLSRDVSCITEQVVPGRDASKSKTPIVCGNNESTNKLGLGPIVCIPVGNLDLSRNSSVIEEAKCASSLPSTLNDGSRGKRSSIKEQTESGISTGPEECSNYESTSGYTSPRIKSESNKKESVSYNIPCEKTVEADVSIRDEDRGGGIPGASGQTNKSAKLSKDLEDNRKDSAKASVSKKVCEEPPVRSAAQEKQPCDGSQKNEKAQPPGQTSYTSCESKVPRKDDRSKQPPYDPRGTKISSNVRRDVPVSRERANEVGLSTTKTLTDVPSEAERIQISLEAKGLGSSHLEIQTRANVIELNTKSLSPDRGPPQNQRQDVRDCQPQNGQKRDGAGAFQQTETPSKTDESKYQSSVPIQDNKKNIGVVSQGVNEKGACLTKPARTCHHPRSPATFSKDTGSVCEAIVPEKDCVSKSRRRDSAGTKVSSSSKKYSGRNESDASSLETKSLKCEYVEVEDKNFSPSVSQERSMGVTSTTGMFCKEIHPLEAKRPEINKERETRCKPLLEEQKADARPAQKCPLPDKASPQNKNDQQREKPDYPTQTCQSKSRERVCATSKNLSRIDSDVRKHQHPEPLKKEPESEPKAGPATPKKCNRVVSRGGSAKASSPAQTSRPNKPARSLATYSKDADSAQGVGAIVSWRDCVSKPRPLESTGTKVSLSPRNYSGIDESDVPNLGIKRKRGTDDQLEDASYDASVLPEKNILLFSPTTDVFSEEIQALEAKRPATNTGRETRGKARLEGINKADVRSDRTCTLPDNALLQNTSDHQREIRDHPSDHDQCKYREGLCESPETVVSKYNTKYSPPALFLEVPEIKKPLVGPSIMKHCDSVVSQEENGTVQSQAEISRTCKPAGNSVCLSNSIDSAQVVGTTGPGRNNVCITPLPKSTGTSVSLSAMKYLRKSKSDETFLQAESLKVEPEATGFDASDLPEKNIEVVSSTRAMFNEDIQALEPKRPAMNKDSEARGKASLEELKKADVRSERTNSLPDNALLQNTSNREREMRNYPSQHGQCEYREGMCESPETLVSKYNSKYSPAAPFPKVPEIGKPLEGQSIKTHRDSVVSREENGMVQCPAQISRTCKPACSLGSLSNNTDSAQVVGTICPGRDNVCMPPLPKSSGTTLSVSAVKYLGQSEPDGTSLQSESLKVEPEATSFDASVLQEKNMEVVSPTRAMFNEDIQALEAKRPVMNKESETRRKASLEELKNADVRSERTYSLPDNALLQNTSNQEREMHNYPSEHGQGKYRVGLCDPPETLSSIDDSKYCPQASFQKEPEIEKPLVGPSIMKHCDSVVSQEENGTVQSQAEIPRTCKPACSAGSSKNTDSAQGGRAIVSQDHVCRTRLCDGSESSLSSERYLNKNELDATSLEMKSLKGEYVTPEERFGASISQETSIEVVSSTAGVFREDILALEAKRPVGNVEVDSSVESCSEDETNVITRSDEACPLLRKASPRNRSDQQQISNYSSHLGQWRDREDVCEPETQSRSPDRCQFPVSTQNEPGIEVFTIQATSSSRFRLVPRGGNERIPSPSQTSHTNKPARTSGTFSKYNDNTHGTKTIVSDECKLLRQEYVGTRASSTYKKCADKGESNASSFEKKSLKSTPCVEQVNVNFRASVSREKNMGKVSPISPILVCEEVEPLQTKPTVLNEEVPTRHTEHSEVQMKANGSTKVLPRYGLPQCEQQGMRNLRQEMCDQRQEKCVQSVNFNREDVARVKTMGANQQTESKEVSRPTPLKPSELESVVVEWAAGAHEQHEKPDLGVLRKMDRANELRATAKMTVSPSEKARLVKEAANIERSVAESVAICAAKNEVSRLREAASCAATREEEECLEQAASDRESLVMRLEQCAARRAESEARKVINEVEALREAARVTTSEAERSRFEREATEREKLIPDNTALRKAQIEAARLREYVKWSQSQEERICLETAAEVRETFVKTICASSTPLKSVSGRDIREGSSGMVRQSSRRPLSSHSFGPKSNSKPSSTSSFVDLTRKEHLSKSFDQNSFSKTHEVPAGQLGSEENIRKKRTVVLTANRLNRLGTALSDTCQTADVSFLILRTGNDVVKRPQSQPQTTKRSDGRKTLAKTFSEESRNFKVKQLTATFKQKEREDSKLEDSVQEKHSKGNEMDSDRLASYSSAKSFLSRISDGKSESDLPNTNERKEKAMTVDPGHVKTVFVRDHIGSIKRDVMNCKIRVSDHASTRATLLGSDKGQNTLAERTPHRNQEGESIHGGHNIAQNETKRQTSMQNSVTHAEGSTTTDYQILLEITQESHSQKHPSKDTQTNSNKKHFQDNNERQAIGRLGNIEQTAELEELDSPTMKTIKLADKRLKTGGDTKSSHTSSVEESFTISLSKRSICVPMESTVSKNIPPDSISIRSSKNSTCQRSQGISERSESKAGSTTIDPTSKTGKNGVESSCEVTGRLVKSGPSARESTTVKSFTIEDYPTEIAQSRNSDTGIIMNDVIAAVDLTARHAAGASAARDQAFEAAGFAVKAVAYDDLVGGRRAVQVAQIAAQAAAEEAFCAARESAKASSLASTSKCSRRAAALATASALAAQQDSVAAGRFYNNAADALRCLEVTDDTISEERLAAAAFKQVISSSVDTADAAAKAELLMTEAASAARAAECAIAEASPKTDTDVSRLERAALAAAKGAAEAAAQAQQKAQSAANASIEATKIASYSSRSTFVVSAARHSCCGADDAKSQAAAASKAASAASAFAEKAQNVAAVIASSAVSETAKTAAYSARIVAAEKAAAARSASECSQAKSIASEAAARIASYYSPDRQHVSTKEVKNLQEFALAKTAEAEAAASAAVEKAECAASHAAKAQAVYKELLQLANQDEAAAFACRFATAEAEEAARSAYAAAADAQAASYAVNVCRNAAQSICLHLPREHSSESTLQIKSPSPVSDRTITYMRSPVKRPMSHENRSDRRHSGTSRTRGAPRLPSVTDT